MERPDESAQLTRLVFWGEITAALFLLLGAFTSQPPTSSVLFVVGLGVLYSAVRLSIAYHRARRNRSERNGEDAG